MANFKIVELNKKDLMHQNILTEETNEAFYRYIEKTLEEHVNNGWSVYSPSILTNPFGTPTHAIIVFEKPKTK